MATKKTTDESTEVSSVDTEVAEAPAKADLEHVDATKVAQENASFPAPKVVNFDNGTQSFQDTTEPQKVTHPEIVQGAFSADNSDPTKLVRYENIETPVVVRETRVTDERLHKADFDRIIADEEKNRPGVFADRKADLEKQRDAAPE